MRVTLCYNIFFVLCAQVLLSMALDCNTDPGKHAASQALARLAITTDPTISFQGQRVCTAKLNVSVQFLFRFLLTEIGSLGPESMYCLYIFC